MSLEKTLNDLTAEAMGVGTPLSEMTAAKALTHAAQFLLAPNVGWRKLDVEGKPPANRLIDVVVVIRPYRDSELRRVIVRNVIVHYPNNDPLQRPIYCTATHSHARYIYEPQPVGPWSPGSDYTPRDHEDHYSKHSDYNVAVETCGSYVTHWDYAVIDFPPPTAHNEL